MTEKKKTIKKDVQDTMACSAFAEAGEPCPIHQDKKKNNPWPGLRGRDYTTALFQGRPA